MVKKSITVEFSIFTKELKIKVKDRKNTEEVKEAIKKSIDKVKLPKGKFIRSAFLLYY